MQLKKKHRRHALKNKKRCWYCGDVLTRRSASIDHQVPVSRGGDMLGSSNIVLACKPCNNEKDNMDVGGYRLFLEQRTRTPVVFFGERL